MRSARRVNAGAFGNSVRKHLRAAGYFQKDLAVEIGLRPKVLSRKLNGNGNAYLTEQDVRRIITTLARWKTISTREEALHLLELAQMEPTSFSAEEWQTPPFNRLAGGVTSTGALHQAHMHNLPAPLTRLVGRDWPEATLVLPLGDSAGETLRAARAKALSEAARLVCLQDEQSKAVALAEESIALWRELGNPLGLATALFYRGWPATAMGDYALAKSVYEQGLQLLSPANDVWLRAQLLFYLGAVAGFTRDFEQMRAFYAQSRELFEQVGDKSAVADVLKDQGGMAVLEGKYSEAIANLLESIELSHLLGYKQFVATGLGLLGFAVGMRGEPDPTLASLQAAKLWGATIGLLGAIGSSSWLETLIPVQEMILQIRSRVDRQQWKEAWFAGHALTKEGAIELARSTSP